MLLGHEGHDTAVDADEEELMVSARARESSRSLLLSLLLEQKDVCVDRKISRPRKRKKPKERDPPRGDYPLSQNRLFNLRRLLLHLF